MSYCENTHIAKAIVKSDAIRFAIDSGSIESVKLLINRLNNAKIKLNEQQLLSYCLHAIKNNQLDIVDYFLDEITRHYQSDILKTITMSTTAVERTDILILHRLKKCGVKFTKEAEGVIDNKSDRQVGISLATGIMLNKFTDFIRETLFKQEGISYNIEKLNELKQKLKTIAPKEELKDISPSNVSGPDLKN